jgi:hypothetical protein
MSVHKRRIQTIQTLIAGSVVSSQPDHTAIQSELSEVLKVQRVPQLPRRRLLQLFHSSRAIDTTISRFLTWHGITTKSGLGANISELTKTHKATLGTLTKQEEQRYKQQIANVRNHYMHTAGAFPGQDNHIINLLSEMEACLVSILNL